MSASRWRVPAEWEPQSAVVMAWPHEGTDWAARLAQVEPGFTALAAAIARFEPVLLCVADDAVQARARKALDGAAVDPARIRYVHVPYDDTWLRDSGPITLRRDGHFRLLDFRFTGWGGRFDADRDDRLVAGLFDAGLFPGARHERVEFALEGGAVECDGAGTVLTTARCMAARHPDLGREGIGVRLREALDADRVLWLDHGFLEGDDTDAHIDTLARFCDRRTIAYQACFDRQDPHYAELSAMADELAALRTPEGSHYRLLPLPWAQPVVDEGRRLAASYANFLIVNGAVLIPSYGDPADRPAQAALAGAFPGREIVPVPCRPLIWQNGSLHCLTMQLPEGLTDVH
ncbi:MAG TPA: agmatine deiminase family protein [Xanthomonadaceae bacterium]|nr:agmatine deiminase family protein [Xanthomonadaceae bacterium]